MRILILLTIAASAAALLLPEQPKDRPGQYQACKQSHPEGYCRFEYLPEQARASR
jgi:hypothetical protein